MRVAVTNRMCISTDLEGLNSPRGAPCQATCRPLRVAHSSWPGLTRPSMDPRVKPGDDELGSCMAQGNFVVLEDRAILAVSGPDRRSFLQGLVSNDVEKVAADRAVYAALLTAQGKYLHDFIMIEQDDAIWLDTERSEEHTSELQSQFHLVCRL